MRDQIIVPAGAVFNDFGSVIVGGQILTGEWCMVKTGRVVQLVMKLERRKICCVRSQEQDSLPIKSKKKDEIVDVPSSVPEIDAVR